MTDHFGDVTPSQTGFTITITVILGPPRENQACYIDSKLTGRCVHAQITPAFQMTNVMELVILNPANPSPDQLYLVEGWARRYLCCGVAIQLPFKGWDLL